MNSESQLAQNPVVSPDHNPLPNENPQQPLIAANLARSSIGKTVLIKGDIGAKEDILVNGKVEGTIAAKNHCVEIGPAANINANIFARIVVINGEVRGDVYASEQIKLAPTGRVNGNIHAIDICIEAGAYLKGKIDMAKQDVLPPPAPSAELPSHPDQDDHAQKSGAFNFLFRKHKEVARLESDQHELTSLQSDQKPDHEKLDNKKDTLENKDSAKNADLESEHDELPQDSKAQSVSAMNMAYDQSDDRAFIGESMMIKGEIHSEEELIIQGGIDGIVCVKENALYLGPHSLLKANIFAKSIIAQGEIKGSIYASEQVLLKKPAHVIGDIHSPHIGIESGVILMGDVEMEAQDLEQVFIEKSNAEIIQESSLSDPANLEGRGRRASNKDDSFRNKDQAWPIFYPRS